MWCLGRAITEILENTSPELLFNRSEKNVYKKEGDLNEKYSARK